MSASKHLSKLATALLIAGAVFSSACTKTPAKAPGSDPADMTPEGHQAAAAQEQQLAEEHRQEKEGVPPSKPNMEFTQKAQHQQQADKHEDFAGQHEKAAESAK